MDVVPDEVSQLASLVGPEEDEILTEMSNYADKHEFPTVGPQIGGWLSVLTRLSDARRVFEFGSGFGYSAYWFAQALPADGEIVLTEIDESELDMAREYFRTGGLSDRAQFEHGDAIEIIDKYEAPFDIVLIDNEKERYVEAFEAVREKLRPGSLILSDNAITAEPIDRDDVIALLDGENEHSHQGDEITDASRGIAAYLSHIGEIETVETSLLPLGEGMAVSVVC